MISRKSFKVVLLGEIKTGKTCLAKRYFENTFSNKEKATIGAALESRIFTVDGKEYEMAVWDTSGEERFRSVTRLFYRDAAAAIICYDVSQFETFKVVPYWLNELTKTEPDCKIYICGAKRDLLEGDLFKIRKDNPTISFAECYAEENSVKFFLTSSLTGQNVDKLFNEILKDFVDNWQNSPESSTSMKLVEESHTRRLKKCC